MILRVQLFASLRERLGASEVVLDDLPEALTMGELKAELALRRPEAGDLRAVAGVVGTEYVKDERRLCVGDEVALLPPVSGGSSEGDDALSVDERLARGWFELSAEPLDAGELSRRVGAPSFGANVTFTGTTRDTNRGQRVEQLDYEAFAAMSGPEMERIFADCRTRFGDDDGRRLRMLCAHRTGVVGVGEPSVCIAVASPHREAAFAAARFLIDELKRRLPIWKKEVYADGHHWIGDRS